MGGVASGSVFGATQRLNKVSRIWSQQPAAAAGQRAYAAFSLDSRQGILWRFGGLSNDGVSLSTTVLASGPLPTWADTVVGCEGGYTGALCTEPVCRDNCWGVGRCIAPDLCECSYGFTGPLCSQQLCSTCGIGLIPLNQPIYWPRARDKALRCISTLRGLINSIKQQLPFYPETCAQNFTQAFPFN